MCYEMGYLTDYRARMEANDYNAYSASDYITRIIVNNCTCQQNDNSLQ